ncbi:lipid-A-disaccharide synthase [Deltaproteobacteria bacterium Smac51]|nr:lipid-A-disaccharide synthase [Deltaproteobacteria bacterium Smac51]
MQPDADHSHHKSSEAERPLKIMISAGESSGEIHGAALMEEAAARGLNWKFVGLGGDRMAAAGARLLAHINDTAVMGLTEVVGHLKKILSIRSAMKRGLELERPAALILIDFPDFNFGLARHAHELGIPVIYYICPQVWAWRSGRLKFLARYIDRRAVLFPFEKKFYEERGVSADWVGHPILDELPPMPLPAEIKTSLGFEAARPLLTLMPGSRKKVVERLTPVILGAAEILLAERPDLQLAMPKADSIAHDYLNSFLQAASPALRERVVITPGRSRELLAASEAALVVSGTSSVEAVFLGTPMAVTYKVSDLSWLLGRLLVSVPYVSIANLVAGREVIPEFLQDRATPENLAGAVRPLLSGGPERDKMTADLASVRAQLGEPGASGRVLDIVSEEISKAEGGRNAL